MSSRTPNRTRSRRPHKTRNLAAATGRQLPKPQVVDLPLAGWWRRAGGLTIDSLILVGFALLISDPIGRTAGAPVLATVLQLVAVIAYGALFISWRGATVGMHAVRVLAVDSRERKPLMRGRAWARASVACLLTSVLPVTFGATGTATGHPDARNAAALVGGAFALIGLVTYLWPLWDPLNRTLQDKVAGSVVVVGSRSGGR
jgi:uncharacterized RDD family membrane protein YckC